MPHRRREEKGSFGGKLDELIKVFDRQPPSARSGAPGKQPDDRDGDHVNDRLFENAWRRQREK